MERRHAGSTAGACLLAAAMALGLAGCASGPPAPHPWIAIANVDHLPLQGMSGVPRVVAEDRPLVLANMANEAERDAKRRADTALGIAAGAAQGGVAALAALGVYCVPLPALCAGIAAVGAATVGAQVHAVAVSAEQADRLAAVFRAQATASALQLASQLAAESGAQAGELRLHVAGVVMIPTPKGVTFRLAAQAQAFPLGQPEWQPTVHFVTFPTRRVEDWLAADARQLRTDLQAGLSALGQSIASAYLPYEKR